MTQAQLTWYKDLADLIQSIATVLALIAGGVVSYVVFLRKREGLPSANMTHDARWFKLPNDDLLFALVINVKNTGKTHLPVCCLHVHVSLLAPLPPDWLDRQPPGCDPQDKKSLEHAWPELCYREHTWDPGSVELEPGEDEQIPCEFVLPRDVEAVKVYSWLANERKRKQNLGWSETTYHRAADAPATKERPNG